MLNGPKGGLDRRDFMILALGSVGATAAASINVKVFLRFRRTRSDRPRVRTKAFQERLRCAISFRAPKNIAEEEGNEQNEWFHKIIKVLNGFG
jgi:hypothetical protein